MANGVGGADQNTAAYPTPQEIKKDPVSKESLKFETLFAGGSNTIFGYEGDTLYGWGLNNTGQLCNGEIGYDASYEGGSATVYRVRVLNTDKAKWPIFKRIIAARYHVCALTEDDSLYCWGSYDYGQFGDGSKGDGLDGMRPGNTHAFSEYHAPKKIGTDKWLDIATMDKNSCGIKADGTLWCWGNAEWGLIGNGKVFLTPPTALDSGFEYTDIWKAKTASGECISRFESTSINGDLKGQKATYPTTCFVPQQVGTEANWVQVSGKSNHVCAVNSDNELYCWGENEYGQIGNGKAGDAYSTLPSNYDLQAEPFKVGDDYIYAAAGGNFTCALKKDKTVWCWGRGVTGAPGVVTDKDHPVTTPRQVNF